MIIVHICTLPEISTLALHMKVPKMVILKSGRFICYKLSITYKKGIKYMRDGRRSRVRTKATTWESQTRAEAIFKNV